MSSGETQSFISISVGSPTTTRYRSKRMPYCPVALSVSRLASQIYHTIATSGTCLPDALGRIGSSDRNETQAKARHPKGKPKTIEMPGFSSACLGICDSLMTRKTPKTVLHILGAVRTIVRRIWKYIGSPSASQAHAIGSREARR